MAGLFTALIVVVSLFLIDSNVESSPDVLKEFGINFRKSLNECLEELNLPKSITTDFYEYWKHDFVITNRDTGCVIWCLAKKLGFHQDGKLHRENARDFTMKHGADEVMATQVVDVIEDCEKGMTETDDCIKVMGIANCFKVEMHKRNWAPEPEILAGELLSDM